MVFIKKKIMNKLFRILVFILAIEIILGYLIYLNNSKLISGHYVSANLKGLDKIIRNLNETINKTEVNKEKNVDNEKEETEEEIKKSNEKSVLLTNYQNNKCQKYQYQNQHVKLSGIRSLRQPLEIQATLDFFNNYDDEENYLILLIGNSETRGSFQDINRRLHSLMQNNLRNLFDTDKLFVVNGSYRGGMLSDHLNDLLIYSRYYKPDLTIFYTGGNELTINEFYKAIVDKHSINIKNFTRYNFINNQMFFPNNARYCLDDQKYLNENNIPEINLSEHFELHYENIDQELKKRMADYLFYVQPINPNEKDNVRSINIQEMKNLSINSKNFINLNLSNVATNIDYVDLFHSRDAALISQTISDDIKKKFSNKIINKLKK